MISYFLVQANHRGSFEWFYIDRASQAEEPFRVKSIEGLDPVKATVSTVNSATTDGAIFVGSRAEMRNIVIKFGFNPAAEPGATITSLRRRLYRMFYPKNLVSMSFVSDDDMEDVTIDGYVESFETSLFSKEPEVTISILCPMPYFSALEDTEITASPETFIDLPLESDVAIGFKIDLTIGPTGGGSSVYYIDNWASAPIDEALRVYPDEEDFVPGDVISIDTRRGQREVRVNGGIWTGYAKSVDWPLLRPGANRYLVYPYTGYSEVTVTYRKKYGGL